MFEAALFRHDRIPGNALDCRLHRICFKVCYAHCLFVNNGHFAIAQKKDVARVLQYRGNVGSNKKLAVAQPDDDGRPLPHGDDHIGLIGVDY